MQDSDFHTHTTFSDGRDTMEAMVKRAIELDFSAIGISDHSHTPFDLRYCMPDGVLPTYHAELKRLKEKYAGQIEIYAGLEWDGFARIDGREHYDYLLGDCHYIKVGERYHSVDHAREEHFCTINDCFSGDAMAYVRAYFDTYVDCTERNRPDILGHFDLVRKFGAVSADDPRYQAVAKQAMEACLAVTPVVELNMNPPARGIRSAPYPEDFLLRFIREKGGEVMICSDAHSTAQLGGYFDAGRELLRQAGFRSTVTLCRGRFTQIAL